MTSLSPEAFLRLTRDLCEVLQALKDKELCHSDLHDKNVLVRRQQDVLSNTESLQIAVIDTGQLKTEQRRLELLELWQQKLSTLEEVGADDNPRIAGAEERLRNWLRCSNARTRSGSSVISADCITECAAAAVMHGCGESISSVICRSRCVK